MSNVDFFSHAATCFSLCKLSHRVVPSALPIFPFSFPADLTFISDGHTLHLSHPQLPLSTRCRKSCGCHNSCVLWGLAAGDRLPPSPQLLDQLKPALLPGAPLGLLTLLWLQRSSEALLGGGRLRGRVGSVLCSLAFSSAVSRSSRQGRKWNGILS